MVTSLISCGYITYKQVKTFARLAGKSAIEKHIRSGSSEKENMESLSLCKKVVDFYGLVFKTAPNSKIGDRSKDPWTAYEESNRVAFTDDVLTPDHFLDKISAFTQSAPGRMTTLGKEIASLTTSLPPGIFIKIAESKMDSMKALITGAEGLPSAGGLFT